MTDQPWYRTLFERDWYDLLAPGGAGSPVDAVHFVERTDQEARFVSAALALPHGAALLDLCCGWGRHTVRLAKSGYAMTGLDLSAYHLELAKQAALDANVSIEWLEADMRRIPKPDATFAGVTSLFTSFGYFDDDDNQRVLGEVARVLASDGAFFIDVINRDWLMGVFQEADWREAPDGRVILDRRRWDAATGRVHAQWTIIDAAGNRRTHSHDERIYTLQELSLRLAAVGLRVVEAFGDFDGSKLRRDGRRLIVLAKKV